MLYFYCLIYSRTFRFLFLWVGAGAPRGDMCVRGTAQKGGFGSHGSHDGFICIEVYRSTDLKKVLSEAGSSAPDHPFFVRKMRCEGTLLV